MGDEQVSIRTRDGECPAYVFTPSDGGRHPAVIFYMDGLGIRPTIFEMGQRLADYGYVVLVPDLFYRAGPYEALDPKKVFASGDVRAAIGHLFASTDNRRAGEDTEAFLAYLESRQDVAGTKVGTTGYCMGGGMSLTAAGTYPDRVAARGQLPRRQPGHRLRTQPPSPRPPDRGPRLRRRSGERQLLPTRDG